MAIVVAPRITRRSPSPSTPDTASSQPEIARRQKLDEVVKPERPAKLDQLVKAAAPKPRFLVPPAARYEDESAGLALERLRRTPGVLSGEAMAGAILDAIRDRDGNGASSEYRDLRRFADANWQRMSPEARRAFRAYEREALAAQAEGRDGIPAARLEALEARLNRAGDESAAPFRVGDESVRRALAPLHEKAGPITSSDMLALFGATLDRDGELFGQEHRAIARFVDDNWGRLTPGARAAFQQYDAAARAAQADGRSGGSLFDVAQLLQAMWSRAALADDRRLLPPLRG